MPEALALVAGGAGFLGAHLCRALLARGAAVICLDNFSTGHHVNLDACRLAGRFTLVEHDITQPLPAGLARQPIHQIYNLACPASPPHYQRDPIQTLLTSVLGTQHLLLLARAVGARFLQASTSEVYGDPQVQPQPETYLGNVNPVGIRACYDEGKRAAEALVFDHHRQYGTAVRLARIFNTYGPLMAADDGRVISNFILQALRGAPLTVYGEGSQTRSFCYVDDLIGGLLALMDAPGAALGPLNLGNDTPCSVRELAEQIRSLCASGSLLCQRPLPADDPRQRCPDLTLARQLLGWSPQVPLREGLERTIAYWRPLLGSA